MAKRWIYEIADPDTGTVFYVGSTGTLAGRVRGHLLPSNRTGSGDRIAPMMAANRLPIFTIFKSGEMSHAEAREFELRRIAEYPESQLANPELELRAARKYRTQENDQ